GNMQTMPDSGVKYAEQGLALADQINYKQGKADCLLVLGRQDVDQGNFAPGIQHALDALKIYKDIPDYVGMASVHLMLQGTYRDVVGDYRKALCMPYPVSK